MATSIGVAEVTLYFDESSSLKEKRRVVRSISQRLRNTFNLAVAEVADLNDMRIATIAMVCVSNDQSHAQEMLAKAISFVERNVEMGVLGEVATEIIPY